MIELRQHEVMVKMRMDARGQTDLFESLRALEGAILGGTYTVRHLVDVGGQGILFAAEDQRHPGAEVLIKMPYLPYHRSAYFDLAMIEQARVSLWWECYVLIKFQGTILPEYYDLFDGVNPLLHPAWGSKVIQREPYLAMELIRGQSLEEITARLHTGDAKYETIEQLAWNVMYQVIDLCDALWVKERFLYTDLRPQNILLAGKDDRRSGSGWRRTARVPTWSMPECKTDTPVRVIDAGSVVKWKDTAQEFPHHPSYAPPGLQADGQADENRVLQPSFVIYTLGKTIYHLLTNQEPLPGRDPDFEEPILNHYSPNLRGIVHSMIHRDHSSFSALKQTISAYAESYLYEGTSPWVGIR